MGRPAGLKNPSRNSRPVKSPGRNYRKSRWSIRIGGFSFLASSGVESRHATFSVHEQPSLDNSGIPRQAGDAKVDAGVKARTLNAIPLRTAGFSKVASGADEAVKTRQKPTAQSRSSARPACLYVLPALVPSLSTTQKDSYSCESQRGKQIGDTRLKNDPSRSGAPRAVRLVAE